MRGRLFPFRVLFNLVWCGVLLYASYHATFARSPVMEPVQQITPSSIKPTPDHERPNVEKKPPDDDAPVIPTKPPLTLSSLQPDSGASGDYTFLLRECHHTNDTIWCSAQVTNLTDERATFGSGSLGNSVDNEGNLAQVMFGSVQYPLIPGVATKVEFRVYDKHQLVTSVNLELIVDFEADRESYQHLIYKDVPVQ